MRMGCFPGVVGFGTHHTPNDIYVIHLDVCERPVLVEARVFLTLGDFKNYWWEFRQRGDVPFLIAEHYSPGPHGVLDYLTEFNSLERRHIGPFASDYQEDIVRLGLDRSFRRACAVALSVIFDFQAYCTAQVILEELLAASRQLNEIQLQASKLLLATGSRVDHNLLRIPF